MAAIIAYLMHRLSKLEAGGTDGARMLAELESLKQQLESTDHTLGKLEERMDFTEKLLGDGSPRGSRDE